MCTCVLARCNFLRRRSMVIKCGGGSSRVSFGTAGIISTSPSMPSVGTPMVAEGVQVEEGSVFNVNLLEITAVRWLVIFPRLHSNVYLDGGDVRAKVNARTYCVPLPLTTAVVFDHFHISFWVLFCFFLLFSSARPPTVIIVFTGDNSFP